MQPPTASEAGGKGGDEVPESSTEESPKDIQSRQGNLSTEDKEVAYWVKDALDRRQRGLLGVSEKPALHAVALDSVPGSPLLDDPTSFPA